MSAEEIHIIATTISGSVSDWGKMKKIVPLFAEHGHEDVVLHTVTSHDEARRLSGKLVAEGRKLLISAGGSGTFNSVLEGCIDSGLGLNEITLGFLRKGSADLIGKVLGMPDEIEAAAAVFAESIDAARTVKCDVIKASTGNGENHRHFVGYGGVEIFGRIPHYTENRFIKYYKGLLSQFFGDLGPFFVGAFLSTLERTFSNLWREGTAWKIFVDGKEAGGGLYQAMIITNGYLGPDLPFARGVPLGSGDFYMFAIRDIGLKKLPGQFRRAWDASILKRPEEFGFESYRVLKKLEIAPESDNPFPVNIDGSTMLCRGPAQFQIIDSIRLISGSPISG